MLPPGLDLTGPSLAAYRSLTAGVAASLRHRPAVLGPWRLFEAIAEVATLRFTRTTSLRMAVAFLALAGNRVAADDFEPVARILVRHCAGCHNASDPAGGLDLSAFDAARKGGESGEPALVAGDVAHSPLLQRIQAGEMPPAGKGTPVSQADQATLQAWIAAGAPWPAQRVLSPSEFTTEQRAGRDWWSIQPPSEPSIPAVGGNWVRNPIDAFVAAELAEHQLSPSPDADRATLIRRATLDLHGLPPTPEDIAAFVADPRPDAYEQYVDQLLSSPRYGERWARHWLDVVRFGESNGYETNTARPNAWPYRDWVIRAFNEDLSYPRFILYQLAGDQFGQDAATGFLVGGAHDGVASPDVELTRQQRQNDLDDMVSTTVTAFLGLTVGCAKCHDHKFDPITQHDYYALQANFAGVRHGERELRDANSPRRASEETELRARLAGLQTETQSLISQHQPLARTGPSPAGELRPSVRVRGNVDRFAPRLARWIRFSIQATNQSEPCLDELEVFAVDDGRRNLALASAGATVTASSVFAGGGNDLHQLRHLNDGKFGNSHSWISAEPGSGWIQIELATPRMLDRVVWARDREGVFQDRLATRYKIELSEDGQNWQLVAGSDDRHPYDAQSAGKEWLSPDQWPAELAAEAARIAQERTAIESRLAQLAPRMAYVGNFGEAEPTHLLYRGEPMQRRDVVAPAGIAAVTPALQLSAETTESERRVALARWIGSAHNPLTARVMVNRIWHYHFGQGLIKTPSDFGFNGGQATHPALLDWLAMRFIADGWSPKAMHRRIMLSSTYRQASRYQPLAAGQDAGNRWLWRFAPRRLEAEAIRDTVLHTSGALDLTMGGRGYDVFEPNTNYVKVYLPKQQFGPAEWRRMVYQEKPRMRQDATFGEFDCPDSSQVMARRNVSTTALQALNLLNGNFMVQQAEMFADRLRREAGDAPAKQVQRAFWLALGRAADEQEVATGSQLISDEGLLVFCRALFNANEFIYLQ